MAEYEAHGRRMRQLIAQAMIRLLGEKPFSKITIQDIMAEADIQRATFYRYFQDKYDVARRINETLAQFLAQNFFDAFYMDRPIDMETEHVFNAHYRDVLARMLHIQIEGVNLQQELFNVFRKNYTAHYPGCTEYEVWLASQNYLAIITWLMDNNIPMSEISSEFVEHAQMRWLSRYFNVDYDTLAEFVDQHKGEPHPK